jgi:hypothetical protein
VRNINTDYYCLALTNNAKLRWIDSPINALSFEIEL